MRDVPLLDPKDNVAVSFFGNENIPKGHKVAVKYIKEGDPVIKYGNPIGIASKDICIGDHVHTHNLKSGLKDKMSYDYKPSIEKSYPNLENHYAFMGYRRKNGDVAIRNEIWVIPTVGCINQTVRTIEKKAKEKYADQEVFAFTHPYGCSQLGEDHENTKKILIGLVKHPNAAGVLVVGLGCENNNIAGFKKSLGIYDVERVRFLTIQDAGDEIEQALIQIDCLVKYISVYKREKIPISSLKIGLKCGGSDAFSGITGNPLLGRFSNILIQNGGTAVMTEVPEMFGAEQILMNRAKNKKVYLQIKTMINNFKEYYISHGQGIHENPSPGNLDGGITTLEEKSLGCILKGGTNVVNEVITYGSQNNETGLVLLEGPGNDPVSITALASAGVHLIIFTTGRGTPLGTCVPVIKVSTNKELYDRKSGWIDIDAETQGSAKKLLELLLDTASGKYKTKTEINGSREISIWKNGVTL